MPVDLSRYPHFQHLVDNKRSYRKAWQEGRWPPGLVDGNGRASSGKPRGEPGKTKQKRPRRPDGGPGTEAHLILSSVGIKPIPGCDCKGYAKQMDMWGVEGCRKRFDMIVKRFKFFAGKYGWAEKAVAAAKAVTSGLALKLNPLDPIPGIVEEAICRAEAKERTKAGRGGE